MATEILKRDEWDKLITFCGKFKIPVPDPDTTFVCVQTNEKGEVIGFMPVQPAYFAGPLHGKMEVPATLARIDDHFRDTWAGQPGLSYLMQWKKGNAIMERVIEKKGA